MRIVNVRDLSPNDPDIVYVGRGSRGWLPSPLGNPFSHLDRSKALFKVATVTEAVEAFRHYLWAALHNQPFAAITCYEPVLEQQVTRVAVLLQRRTVEEVFKKLTPTSTLGCHCDINKHPCHAQVIDRAWHWWHTKGQARTPTPSTGSNPSSAPENQHEPLRLG